MIGVRKRDGEIGRPVRHEEKIANSVVQQLSLPIASRLLRSVNIFNFAIAVYILDRRL